jgi:hypothetical protein
MLICLSTFAIVAKSSFIYQGGNMPKELSYLDIIEKGPEIVAYQFIYAVGGYIFWMEHDMADGRIPESDWEKIDLSLTERRVEQLAVIKSLTKYGLTEPVTDKNAPTEMYWKWYRWWKKYMDSLSREEEYKLGKAIENDEDLSSWRPEGNWQD